MFKKLLLLLLIPSVAFAGTQSNTAVRWASSNPTITASSAYTAKDSVGGLLTFTGVTCPTSHNGRIIAVQVWDTADQAVEYDLVLFSSNPTGSTITNKTATNIVLADFAKVLPIINLATTDHFSYSATGLSSLSSLGSSAFSVTTTPDAGTLYGALVTRGTPTYTSTTGVTIRIGFSCD